MQRWMLPMGLLLACRGEPAPPGARSANEPDLAAVASSPTPAAVAQNPFATHALDPEERVWLEGSVEETLPAGSYVYFRVRSDDATSLWVATLAATAPSPPLGRVRVLVLGRADRFHSRRLARDFSPLSFGVVRAESSDRNRISKGIVP
jgi:hypothetical protein